MPHVLVNDISVLFHHSLQVVRFPLWPLGQCRFLPQRLDRAPDSGQHVCVGLRTRIRCRHCPRSRPCNGQRRACCGLSGVAGVAVLCGVAERCSVLLSWYLVVSLCYAATERGVFISYTETSHLERAEGKRSDRMEVETGFLSSLAELSVTAR